MKRAGRKGIFIAGPDGKSSVCIMDFNFYLDTFASHMNEGRKEQFFRARVFRKLRFEAYCCKQKHEAKWINRFRETYGDGNQVTVIMGDWSSRGYTPRGQVPTKNKGFR